MSYSITPLVRRETKPVATDTSPVEGEGIGPKAFRYLNITWMRCLLLALVGIVVRIPALAGERIWDDYYLAQSNPFIKSPALILEAFRHYLFLDSISILYQLVQNIF